MSMALSKREQQVAAMEKATGTAAGAEGVESVPVVAKMEVSTV